MDDHEHPKSESHPRQLITHESNNNTRTTHHGTSSPRPRRTKIGPHPAALPRFVVDVVMDGRDLVELLLPPPGEGGHRHIVRTYLPEGIATRSEVGLLGGRETHRSRAPIFHVLHVVQLPSARPPTTMTMMSLHS